MTLRDLGEFEAIRRLIAARPPISTAAADSIVVDSGDDAAVLRPSPGNNLIATTDTFVEGRHYVSGAALFTAREVGARLAAANLSDLAAMAAQPRWAMLSLGVRPEHPIDDLLEMQAGLAETLAADGAVLVGGNLVAVDAAEWQSVTLLGETHDRRAWRRDGARPGDLVAVTGFPGRAGAGARLGISLGIAAERGWKPLLDAWIRPRSRVALSLALAPLGAVTAAIDISDGFARDLAHLCEASGVGAEVVESPWPINLLLARAAAALEVDPYALAFGPSDDYELLLALAPEGRGACEEIARTHDVRFAVVGTLTERAGELVRVDSEGRRHPLAKIGYDHFR